MDLQIYPYRYHVSLYDFCPGIFGFIIKGCNIIQNYNEQTPNYLHKPDINHLSMEGNPITMNRCLVVVRHIITI